MEKLPKGPKSPERKSGIVRVIAAEEDTEHKVLEAAGELFEEKQGLRKNEKEKTPEQKEVIEFLNQKLPEFVKRYGGEPLVISEDKVHLVPKKPLRKGVATESIYDPIDQSVSIMDVEGQPLLAFAKRLVHEFVHFNAFLSIRFGKERGTIRRMGFKLLKGQARDYAYFYSLDEAMTEELTKRFSKEFLGQCPVLKKDCEKIEMMWRLRAEIAAQSQMSEKELSDMLTDAAYITTVQTREGDKYVEGETTIHTYSLVKEREKLNELISDLYERNKEDYESRDEVFELFARAVMSNQLLPIARLIQKTYGKGSFRKLGEKFGGKMEKKEV